MQANLSESPLSEAQGPSPLRDWSAFSPQADHVLVDLFSSSAARRALQAELPHIKQSGFIDNSVSHLTVSETNLRNRIYLLLITGQSWKRLEVNTSKQTI